MTVRAVLLNCGNHPDDVIEVIGDGRAPKALERGNFVDVHDGPTYSFRTIRHGSGDACRQHEPAAIMSEGPGAGLVRVTFNPSDSEAVNRIKTLAAALINEIEAAEGDGRHKALAKTAIEEGAMWAVKAVTMETEPTA